MEWIEICCSYGCFYPFFVCVCVCAFHSMISGVIGVGVNVLSTGWVPAWVVCDLLLMMVPVVAPISLAKLGHAADLDELDFTSLHITYLGSKTTRPQWL